MQIKQRVIDAIVQTRDEQLHYHIDLVTLNNGIQLVLYYSNENMLSLENHPPLHPENKKTKQAFKFKPSDSFQGTSKQNMLVEKQQLVYQHNTTKEQISATCSLQV